MKSIEKNLILTTLKFNKQWLLYMFLIFLSFLAWNTELFWPGSDSGYYYLYADIILNYINNGIFDSSLDYFKYVKEKDYIYMINIENIFGFNNSFYINETFSYVFLSVFFNYIFNSTYGIIFFQTIATIFTINEIKKILKYYSYDMKVDFWTIFLLMPIILISFVPMKEAFTIFFSTLLFRLYLNRHLKLFILVFLLFYIYRWNLALLFSGFIFCFYISNKILYSKYRQFYNYFIIVVICTVFIIGTKYIAYFGSGYNTWEPKMLISAFVFPLVKFGHYEGWQGSYILFGLWNNIYSLSWYFFLPAFFIAIFTKNSLKSLAVALLIIFVVYGSISSGNQIDRIKLEFYSIYIILGLITFQQIQNKKQYFYYFLVLLFFNFLQASNYSFTKADSSLYEFIIIPKYLVSNLL